MLHHLQMGQSPLQQSKYKHLGSQVEPPKDILLDLNSTPEEPLFKSLWAQVSGMADNCSCGVVGRLGGQMLHKTESYITKEDMKTCSNEPVPALTFKELVLTIMPSNRAFAGPPEWLFWMVLEDLRKKYTSGTHTPELKPDCVSPVTFDFERNPYHKFWAGPSYRVKMWFMSDKVGITINKTCRVNSLVQFIKDNKLGYIVTSKPIAASYSGQVVGSIFTPDVQKLEKLLPKELKIANKLLVDRWKKIKKYKTGRTIMDKVAMKW